MPFYETVDNLMLRPSSIEKLKAADILTTQHILYHSRAEIELLAKVSSREADYIYDVALAEESKSTKVDALSMLNSAQSSKEHLPFQFLNSINFDGIYTNTITEIVGESGSGKTQLCLLISICALLPENLGEHASKVLYMHTKGKFPVERFIELSESFKKKNPLYQDVNFTGNLILKKVYNLKDAMRILQTGIPELLKEKKFPRVVIIDSVADFFRGEYKSLKQRNFMMKQLSVELWNLAHIQKMAIICVNQVSGSRQKIPGTSKIVSTNVPSLGLLWAHLLTTRVSIFRRVSQKKSAVVRAFKVVFSSYHPRLIIDFIITSEGVEILNEKLLK